MNKIVPFNVDYKLVSRIDLFAQALLYISVIVSVLTLVTEKYVETNKEQTLYFFTALNCVLAIGYFVADIILGYVFQAAETKRRNDFFDNSLSTQLANKNTVGYFSNDQLQPGVIKLGVNSFENSFFTKNVSGKMLLPMVIKSIVIVFLFLCVAFIPDKKLFTTILQLALPYTIIQQTIRLFVFKHRIDNIFEKFKAIFSSTTDGQKMNLIIHTVTSYEATLAWGCIQLDSTKFDKMNPELSIEWEEIKRRHNII